MNADQSWNVNLYSGTDDEPDPMADAAYWAALVGAFVWFLPAMLVVAPWCIVVRLWKQWGKR